MKQQGSLTRAKWGKAMLSLLMSLISILYVLPVLAVVLNSFKLNTFVKTETFSFPTAESFAGWGNFIKGMTFGGYPFWKSVFYSTLITVVSTALIAFNDPVALGAMKQLKQMGLSLPDDMAIIGCDNQFFCPYTDPPLTSVDLHPDELAQSAIRELLVARSGEASAFAMMREATLIVRESCGAKLGLRKLD